MMISLFRVLSWCGCAAALGLAAGCRDNVASPQAGNRKTESAPKTVRTAVVSTQPMEQIVKATGLLAPFDRAVLSVKVAGRLDEILVDLGTPVKKGDLIARIDPTDFRIQKDQAQAALAQARARAGLPLEGDTDQIQLEEVSVVKEARALLTEAAKHRERLRALRDQGIVAEAEIETVEASFQVASNRFEQALQEARTRIAMLAQRRAEFRAAQQQLAETEIRAPFEGIIERRQASPGEFINVGAPVATLVRTDPIRLRLDISEPDAPLIRSNQLVRVQIEGDSKIHPGRLTRLSPIISPDNRMLQAEADLPNPEGLLRPGSFIEAGIVVNANKQAIVIPAAARVTFAGLEKVILIQAGAAREQDIATGQALGESIEVLSGLKPGDLIALEPAGLKTGQPVQSAQ